LDPVYPVLFVDAIVVKVRDGQVRNAPFYVVMGVTVNGEREILGIWAGDGAEGARFWLQVFSELTNRGVEDVFIAVCDGLKGLPEAITTTWERTVVQQCIVHLIRNGHFPNEAAALKCLYLVTRSPDPTGGGRARGVMRQEACAERVRDHLRRSVRKKHSLLKPAGPTHRLSDSPYPATCAGV
jgi:transposase-like protein